MQDAADVRLFNEQVQSIRRLPGFQKHHRIPTAASRSAEQFVQALAKRGLEEDLSKKYDALRRAFGFKRRDLESRGPKNGTGAIVTPYFQYEIAVWLDPEEPSQVLCRREVARIEQLDRVLSAAFDEVFAAAFDTLEIDGGEQDLETVVDRIEALDSPAVTVDYDRNLTWCEIRLRGVEPRIRMTPGAMRIVAPAPAAARELIDAFLEIKSRLGGTTAEDRPSLE